MSAIKKTIDDKKESKRRVSTKQFSSADWQSADPELIRAAIAVVTYRGGALRFGYTSDGGAYSVGVYGDGKPYTEYIRPHEDVDHFLRELIAAWAD